MSDEEPSLYSGAERRCSAELTDAQLNRVADLAADKVVSRVQLEVGKSVIRSLLYISGAVILAATAWLTVHGYLKP